MGNFPIDTPLKKTACGHTVEFKISDLAVTWKALQH